MESVKNNAILLLLVIILIATGVAVYLLEKSGEGNVDLAAPYSGTCNVSVLAIEGGLDTYTYEDSINSLEIARAIRAFNNNAHMAVVILMNSQGGSVSAAQEIADALEELNKPSITFVRGSALSGAYWISSASDYIVALPTALVGNIGVTSSYLDEIALNSKEGFRYQEIVSGEYKEIGNVNKPLTPEHRAYLEEINIGLFELFKEAVMTNRAMDEVAFAEVADAKWYLAADAHALGLVDQVGGLSTVKDLLADRLGVSVNELLLCEPTFMGYSS